MKFWRVMEDVELLCMWNGLTLPSHKFLSHMSEGENQQKIANIRLERRISKLRDLP